MTKLKNSNCDKTKKLKLWKNPKLKLLQNSKPQIVTKLKKSNCDKTQNLELWKNSKCSNSDTLTNDEMFSGQLSQFSRCFLKVYTNEASKIVLFWFLSYYQKNTLDLKVEIWHFYLALVWFHTSGLISNPWLEI